MDARSTRIGKVRDFYRFWKEIIFASSGVPGQKRNVYMQQLPQSQDSAPLRGLSAQQAEALRAQGLSNQQSDTGGKTAGEIIRSNALTFFNLIFVVIAVLLCLVGSYRNLTFLPVVIGNTLIGIFQELRAKHILDKMSLLHAPHAVALRDGMEQKLAANDLVRGDIVVLSAGDQIPADATVLQGSVQVNEALLTGESDEIEKEPGSELLSGSFVVAGRCYARLDKVGDESYIAKLTREAKAVQTGEQSEMIRAINRIVKWIGFTIVPIGVILFAQSYFYSGETLQKSVVSAIAAVIGMIPEGLYMLTTIALVLGTMRLARRKVLLHDMKSIETLARVDVLCVDKTGTITEPGMNVQEAHAFECAKNDQFDDEALQDLLADYCLAAQDTNETMQALRSFSEQRRLEHPQEAKIALDVQPFSSSKKYSSITFETGTYLFGAPEFVLKGAYAQVAGELKPFLDAGCRVLLLARSRGEGNSPEPLGYAVLTGRVRENAKETFAYFKEQDVTVKVISGDNARTVSEIAKQAGIENADKFVDAAMLVTDEQLARAAETYTVFGRVTPAQKQKLVQAMQAAGHTVAMTGDGVNDILAMKDADCSVAMASGSEAAAQAAQVVLLDSDFARMPDVVLEGRRVVNNIERSASLFLVKNLFSLLLSVFSAVSFLTYPLEPAQVSLIAMFTIGIPGFLLALEPNYVRIEGNFLKKVLLRALPAALTDVLAVGALVICGEVFGLSDGDIATAATMLLAVVGFMILIRISKPLTKMKYAIILVNIAGLIFCGIFLKQLFALSDMSRICVLLMIIFAFAAESVFRNLSILGVFLERKTGALKEKIRERRGM